MIWTPAIVSLLAAFATASLCAAPVVRCDAPNVDFGEQPGDANVRHIFSVSNVGNTPLALKVASACCGSKAVISRPTLPPSETTEVTVEFSLMGRTGAFHKVIYLATNDPSRPYLSLTLSGRVVGIVSASCLDLTFAATETNGSPAQTVVFTGANRSFAITNIVCDVPWIEAIAHPYSGGVVRLDVRINPPLPADRSRTVVHAYLDAPPGLYFISVVARRQGAISAFPDKVAIPVRIDPAQSSQGHPQSGETR